MLGLALTGMLGALASTLDTHLHWGSSYFTNDLYKRFFCPHVLKREPSPGSLVWMARLGILVLALSIMPHLDSIQTAWKTSLLLQAGIVTTAAVAGARAKANRRRLFHNLSAAFGASFSIFCLLPGLGSWMVGSPAPVWFNDRVWWIGLNLAVGLGGLPLWFWLARLGRLEPEPA